MNADPETLIDHVYDPATFEQLAKIWQQQLTDHLQQLTQRNGNVLNWKSPGALVETAESFLTPHSIGSKSADRFRLLTQTILANGQNLHHPRYIGHQVPASMPVASLFDAIAAVTNQPMAVFEMGPWATAVEHAIVRALRAKIGWDVETSSGLLTSGGSLANLTALLTARNVAFPNCWENGTPPDAILIAHQDAHYCVSRSAGILGLGTRQIRKAPLNDARQMDPQKLDALICEEKRQGKSIIAVAASACATPIGAFDSLSEIAEVCRRHEVWLHVDAAHGGAALMSRQHCHLLQGIELADSVVWDAHKMMFVPALCAAVLYRNIDHRYAAFQQDAPYLFDPSDPGVAAFDSGMCTVECTKRALGLPLWGIWSMFGEEIFEQLVDRSVTMTQTLYALLNEAQDFEPLHEPEFNIQVFRYLPTSLRSAGLERQNEAQQKIRTELIRSGQFYIAQTMLDGKAAQRCTLMNPQTTEADLTDLLQALRDTDERNQSARSSVAVTSGGSTHISP